MNEWSLLIILMKHNLNELSHNISPSYRTRHQSSYFNSLFPLTSVSCKVIWAILAESEDVILFISLMLAFLECTSTEYLNQSCNSRLWCVVCIVYCGMDVGCGRKLCWWWQHYECSDKNERERESIFIFIFRGLGVANLFLTFTKYKAFHWSRVHLPTMCGLTVTVKKLYVNVSSYSYWD